MKTNSILRPALFVAAASACLFTTRAAAGDDSTPPPPPPQYGRGQPGDMLDPEKRLARMTKQLDLSAEQQETLRPLLVEQAETAKKQAETMQKIDAVLTPEQREKLAAFRAGPRGKHRRGEGIPPAAGE